MVIIVFFFLVRMTFIKAQKRTRHNKGYTEAKQVSFSESKKSATTGGKKEKKSPSKQKKSH